MFAKAALTNRQSQEEHVGKSGAMYRPQNAVCLETQNIPDAINHSNFPSPVLRPGETFQSVTAYTFR